MWSSSVSGRKWVGFVVGVSGSASCSMQWSYISLYNIVEGDINVWRV